MSTVDIIFKGIPLSFIETRENILKILNAMDYSERWKEKTSVILVGAMLPIELNIYNSFYF